MAHEKGATFAPKCLGDANNTLSHVKLHNDNLSVPGVHSNMKNEQEEESQGGTVLHASWGSSL